MAAELLCVHMVEVADLESAIAIAQEITEATLGGTACEIRSVASLTAPEHNLL
jgi:hypothetical protein